MTHKERTLQIALMATRARAWLAANPTKAATVSVHAHMMAYHAAVRLPINEALCFGCLRCENDGEAFIRAVVRDDLQPTVAMFLEMRENIYAN